MMMKGFSIMLSVILLASHISLTIGTHFCGGEPVEKKVVFGNTHLGCGMEEMDESVIDPSNSSTAGTSFAEMPCCENEFQKVEATDDFLKDASSPAIHIDFVYIHVLTLLGLESDPITDINLYADASPPPLERDIQILFQTYLI